jgi:tetratricopeptide (TPR) repeat protein
MNSLRLLACIAVLSSSCAAQLPPVYVTHTKRAEEAITRGQFRECADALQQAAAAASSPEYHDEALYRRAHCLFRAGDDATALAELRQLSTHPGPRQARAAFDAALRELDTSERAAADLLAAVVRFQDSGVARAALERVLVHEKRRAGRAAELALMTRVLPQLHDPILREFGLFHHAVLLKDLGQLVLARDQFAALAHHYPYPTGRYWDEATIACANLTSQLGDTPTAISQLVGMLAQREQAELIGSYERSYAEARFALAVLYEQSKRWQNAYTEYLRVTRDYPTSQLRDDAAWQAARLAARNTDVVRACTAAHLLQTEVPASMYTPCLSHVCSDMKPNAACHTYLLERTSVAPAEQPAND